MNALQTILETLHPRAPNSTSSYEHLCRRASVLGHLLHPFCLHVGPGLWNRLEAEGSEAGRQGGDGSHIRELVLERKRTGSNTALGVSVDGSYS